MKRIPMLLALLLFVPAGAFAEYIVVLKDGKRYVAAAKYQIRDGKALIRLENGSLLQIDPSLIDVAASERATRSGLGDARVIASGNPTPATPTGEPEPSLGSMTRLRPITQDQPATVPGASPSLTGPIPQAILNRYRDAYENVGFYDADVKASSSDSLIIRMVADNERQVFNAISATALLMVKLPASAESPMREIELHLLTLRGASAGRFRMSQADAKALESRTVKPQDWFVRNVIF